MARARGKRRSTDATFYSHYERFSVGDVDFDVNWGALEAGVANRGSTEEKPAVRLANGMPARIWYLPIDGPGKPPRITRIDLGAVGWADAVQQDDAGIPFRLAQGHIADEAKLLPDDRKEAIGLLIHTPEQNCGHRLVVLTPPSRAGTDLPRFSPESAARRGMARDRSEEHTSALPSLIRISHATF